MNTDQVNVPIYIASDHAGFELKEQLLQLRPQLPWHDRGPKANDRVDYPDYANLVAIPVDQGHGIGVLICGSGQGMAIRANRFPHVRAAVCWNENVAALARSHNDANILCLGSRLVSTQMALAMLDTFLETQFEGGRHQLRVDKLSAPTAYSS